MTIQDPVIGADGPQPEPARRSSPMPKILIGVAALVVAVGGLAIWRFVSSVGSALDAASAIPADADLYVNVDLATFLDTDLMPKIARTFPDLLDEGDFDDPLADLDAEMQEELGITFTDDVLPWLGRSVGIGVWDIDVTTEEAAFLAAVKVRDADAADQFLERLAGTQGGGTLGLHEGIAIWEFDDEGEAVYAARAADTLVLSNQIESVDTGIETAIGLSESLQQNVNFIETIEALPNGEGNALFYVSGALYQDMTDQAFTEAEAAGLDIDMDIFEGFGNAAATFAITDDGVRIDYTATVSGEFATLYDDSSLDTALGAIPNDAIFYLTADYGEAMDWYRDIIEDAANAEGFDTDDVEAELGFDPITDFLDLFDGRFTIYGRPGDASPADFVDLGGAVLIGVSDPAAMSGTIEDITELIEGEGGLQVVPVDGLHIIDPFDNGVLFRYGVTDDALGFAWNTDPVADAAGPDITTSVRYQETAAVVGDDLAMYVDIPSIVDRYVDEPDAAASLDPVGPVGIAWSSDGVDAVSGTMLLMIDWVEE